MTAARSASTGNVEVRSVEQPGGSRVPDSDAEPIVESKSFLRLKHNVHEFHGFADPSRTAVMDAMSPRTYVFARYSVIDSFGEFEVSGQDLGSDYLELHKLENGSNRLIGYTNAGAAAKLEQKDSTIEILLHKTPEMYAKSFVLVSIPTARVQNIDREAYGDGFLVTLLPYSC